eukprot:511820-Prymnesium_polylepis.2
MKHPEARHPSATSTCHVVSCALSESTPKTCGCAFRERGAVSNRKSVAAGANAVSPLQSFQTMYATRLQVRPRCVVKRGPRVARDRTSSVPIVSRQMDTVDSVQGPQSTAELWSGAMR